MNSTAVMKINEAVTVGLNCLAEGIDTKMEVKKSILSAVSRFLPRPHEAGTLEELPVSVLDLLHENLGLAFDVRAGKIVGASLEGGAQ